MTIAWDAATEIAVEHATWAKRQGQTPADVIRSLGSRPTDAPSWDDATEELAVAWLRIRPAPGVRT